jgi:hypothetical protein
MKQPKYFICPMSRNIVESILNIDSEEFGLLPSRRQIDFNGGYVNGWNTEKFNKYVRSAKIIQIERDHGGPLQGVDKDNGYDSFKTDSRYFNIVHVDPWKKTKNLKVGIKETIKYLKFIHEHNPAIKFEIGTEESIRKFNEVELIEFIETIKNNVNEQIFDNIEFVVIQSGVGLDLVNRKNIGTFDLERLDRMIDIGKLYGKKTKEHNGDYLSNEELKIRFEHGLNSINIGPEIVQLETETYLNHMSQKNIDEFYDLCLQSKKWEKWVDKNFDYTNKKNLIMVCGHYLFSNTKFLNIKNKIPLNINEKVKKVLIDKLENLINCIPF